MATDAIEDDPAFRRDALEDRCLQRAAPWPPHPPSSSVSCPAASSTSPARNACASTSVRVTASRALAIGGASPLRGAESAAGVCESAEEAPGRSKCEALASPTRAFIPGPQRFAECQDRVVIRQRQIVDGTGVGHADDGCRETARQLPAIAPQSADPRDKIRRGPFMNDNHVGAIQCGRMVEVIVVGDNAQVWKRSGEAVKRLRSLIGNQIGPAPAIPGLQGQGRMTASFQFAEDATQEMGIRNARCAAFLRR
jgi:hypothetical protein